MQEPIAISETPPLPGLQMVQQANAAIATVATDFAGTSDPAALAAPFMTWANTDTGIVFRRNAAGSAWVEVGRVFERPLYQGDMGIRRRSFTANGTFVVPTGVTQLIVSAVAGGGGGGASSGYVPNQQLNGGGGGAGQSIVAASFTVTPGQSISITVGGGGAGGTATGAGSAGNPGATGGNTVIGSLATLTGGQGGRGGSGGNVTVGGTGFPNGGMASVTFNTPDGTVFLLSGAGASSPFGGGGMAVASLAGGSIGVAAGGYGAGGGGGSAGTNSAAASPGRSGGSGTPGIVIIEW